MACDALLPASFTQALALTTAQSESALALIGDDGAKRRRTGSSVPKKGKRWGMVDDKPFKPLPYTDLPVGLDDPEIDQFLREQRLEDLHKKIQCGMLEDIEPDIRPPSPPPIYDKSGVRLNSRDIRIRKSMLAEYNRLIRFMIKTIDGYTPPPDWKPQKLVKKILLPLERYPTAPFMGIIIGARGVNHKRLQETTGCKIFIRGKDVGDKYQSDEELQMPQHVHIEGDTEEQIEAAERLIGPLLNPESPEFEYARTHGMQQLAVVNGFTIAKSEQRCSICMALGHLGFDCPEASSFNYKMANVVCAICGDRGHVASDCKQAMDQHQKENIDWKVEAEKKHTLDAEYKKMMSEMDDLGVQMNLEATACTEPIAAPVVDPQAALNEPGQPHQLRPALLRPGLGLLRPPGTGAAPPQRPMGGAPAVAATAKMLLAAAIERANSEAPATVAANGSAATAFAQPRPRGLCLPQPATALAPQLKAPPRPWRPWQTQTPLQPRLRPNIPYKAPPPSVTARSSFGGCAPWAAVGNNSAQTYNMRGRPDVDDSVLCPAALVALAGTVLGEMSLETGARISIGAGEPGGQRILIHGSPEARERAKMHFRAWLSVQSGSQGPGPPPEMEFLPEGFPPDGFPPSMDFPPDGFPPVGFPTCLDTGGQVAFPLLSSSQQSAVSPSGLPASGFPPEMAPPQRLIPSAVSSPSFGSPGPQSPHTAAPPVVCAPPGMPQGFGVSWDEL